MHSKIANNSKSVSNSSYASSSREASNNARSQHSKYAIQQQQDARKTWETPVAEEGQQQHDRQQHSSIGTSGTLE